MNKKIYSKQNAKLFFELCEELNTLIKKLPYTDDMNIPIIIDNMEVIIKGFRYELDICEVITNDEIYPYIHVIQLNTVENLISIITAIEVKHNVETNINKLLIDYNEIRNNVVSEFYNTSLDELLYLLNYIKNNG